MLEGTEQMGRALRKQFVVVLDKIFAEMKKRNGL
jgi:hypothetical protein